MLKQTWNNSVVVWMVAATIIMTLHGVFPEARAQAERSRSERARALQARLVELVAKTQDKIKRDPAPVEVRDVTNGALVAAASGDPRTAERLMRVAFDTQDMKPGPTFGELPWNLGTRDIHDANAIDFGTESLGPLLAGHAKQLSPEFLAYIRPHAAASLVALARQPILVSYSNIYTMNFTSTLLIAKWLGDQAMIERGYKALDTWLDYTGKAGIHEFDSPTYNAVVLNSLYVGFQYSASADVRAKYRKALDYLWTDLAANYFAGGRKIAGAHSRDYDFLYGQGSIDAYYFLEGFQDDFAPNLSLERAFLLESTLEGGYRATQKHFGGETTRVVTQRFDTDPQRYRYTYVAPGFALGIANGHYGPQDKMFAMDFAGVNPLTRDKPIPTIYLATTTTGLPYGKDRTLDKSGHSKPRHLENGIAAVQDRGLALVLADANPKTDKSSDQFFLDMVLPSAGTFSINNETVLVNAKLDRKLNAGDIVGVRVDNACFAALPFAVSGPVTGLAVKADQDGLSFGAFRLSTSFRVKSMTDALRSAYLVLAQECHGDGNAAAVALRAARVRSADLPHQWTVDATLGATTLTVTYDLDARQSSDTRVNGVTFATSPLHVLELKNTSGAPAVGGVPDRR